MRLLSFLAALLLAPLIAIGALAIPRDATYRSREHVQFGLPFAFVTQDFSTPPLDAVRGDQYYRSLRFNPYVFSTKVDRGRFWASAASFSIAGLVVAFALDRSRRRSRRRRSPGLRTAISK